jgi:hypothetical protein
MEPKLNVALVPGAWADERNCRCADQCSHSPFRNQEAANHVSTGS